MRHPQVLIHERDGRLATLLRGILETRRLRWPVREPRDLAGCLRLLQRGGPAVLIVRAGRDLERELTLLERIAWLHPDTATVFVGDAEHAALTGLAWDLGAHYVLLLPQSRELLPDVVIGLMGEAP
jgi:DNA-binding NarL/FixJ family response regulator